MFHKNVLTSLGSISPQQIPASSPQLPNRITLVPPGGEAPPQRKPSPLLDLIAIAAPRCSSFFAEAAVLVLVLALLDRFMLKGRMELNWVISALAISVALLIASIVTDFSSRRWLQRH
ncbi:hypothetical protein [Tunturiibacter gelidoferens]|uniref:Uncharacterized protein n=1 Tax=Tunturiibacter lichenicola TaxID=2051959 RepID=A0A7Y9NPP9_9BACT|nr:hypothetical protein [Edaphobacter lichenicola]NYF53266.1 hypothetical protein [Edaphobacter lichenicola]